MTNLLLEVPADEQTLKLAKEYYLYQMEHGGYSSSTAVEEQRDFQWFKDRFEEYGKFRLYETVNHTITEACGPKLESISEEYGNDGWTIYDTEGLSKLSEEFENARQTLRADGNLHDATNYTIQKCINLTQFAKERGYGVTLSP